MTEAFEQSGPVVLARRAFGPHAEALTAAEAATLREHLTHGHGIGPAINVGGSGAASPPVPSGGVAARSWLATRRGPWWCAVGALIAAALLGVGCLLGALSAPRPVAVLQPSEMTTERAAHLVDVLALEVSMDYGSYAGAWFVGGSMPSGNGGTFTCIIALRADQTLDQALGGMCAPGDVSLLFDVNGPESLWGEVAMPEELGADMLRIEQDDAGALRVFRVAPPEPASTPGE